MRERIVTRFSGRTLRRPTARKKSHELNDAPTEFHEDGAPEYPFLPDEFNRSAPLIDEAEAEAKRKKHLRKMMMYLAAAGAFAVGLFALPFAAATPKEPAATDTPAATAAPTPVSSREAEAKTPAPTAASFAPTDTPTAEPTAAPTPEPEIEGVELMFAYWVDGSGESAEFTLTVRMPLKNLKKGLMTNELEFYAWINGMRGADDWDGIWTASDYDTSFEADENGDLYAYYSGPMYWADHPTPSGNDLVTFAAAGVFFDGAETYQESPLSNCLTVGIGGKAYAEDTSNNLS